MVTDGQVRRLREKRMTGKTLEAAAAAAGMSERTARRWQEGALPTTAKAPRTWRTREDPFVDVWESEVVPQLVADTEGGAFRELCGVGIRGLVASRRGSSGRCNGGSGSGGPRTARIARCTSSRWRFRVGKRRSTSRTRAAWG